MKKLILLVSIILLVVGCSKQNQGVSIAFEELGGEVGYQKGWGEVKYRSSGSVSGLGQSQIVGSILTVPHKNISDMYSIPIITGNSRIAEVNYSNDATLEDVKAVRDALDTLIPLKTAKSVLETEKLILEILSGKLETSDEQSNEYKSTKKGLIQFYPSQIKMSDSKNEISKILKDINENILILT